MSSVLDRATNKKPIPVAIRIASLKTGRCRLQTRRIPTTIRVAVAIRIAANETITSSWKHSKASPRVPKRLVANQLPIRADEPIRIPNRPGSFLHPDEGSESESEWPTAHSLRVRTRNHLSETRHPCVIVMVGHRRTISESGAKVPVAEHSTKPDSQPCHMMVIGGFSFPLIAFWGHLKMAMKIRTPLLARVMSSRFTTGTSSAPVDCRPNLLRPAQ